MLLILKPCSSEDTETLVVIFFFFCLSDALTRGFALLASYKVSIHTAIHYTLSSPPPPLNNSGLSLWQQSLGEKLVRLCFGK